MHILHFSLHFLTNNTFDTHVGNCTGLMNPTSSNRSNSILITTCFSFEKTLLFWQTSLTSGLMCRECRDIIYGIPGMSSGSHAKMSVNSRSNNIIR